MFTRRTFLSGAGGLTLLNGAMAGAETKPGGKPMRGIFVIMATPFTEAKEIDYEDLEREVGFMDRSRVHGMVWPQLASEYVTLSREERMKGMGVIAKAARGTKPALVLGVQGPNTEAALDYLKRAEELGPDALIAIPPSEAKSVDDYRRYYAALAGASQRPIFVQTTGGAKGITPPVEMIVGLAKEFPQLGYIKEEADPVVTRMLGLKKHEEIKSVFSGAAGKGMLYEARLGMDGTMPGAPYADVYVQIWEAWQAGDRAAAREVFSKLLLMINLDGVLPGTRQYVMKKRGIFKTTVSRRQKVTLSAKAMEEIDYCLESLGPWLRA
ncbi:MAG: dihydrodipicolinate synthase family protein [Bryobacteraceae bacterium]